jgi:predicted metal-dependent hydrolase
MRLKKEVPQLLPMWGKRIRIYYRGVTKLCPNCFGAHARKNCRSEKVSWIQYVLRFMENNPDIPPEFYGKWWKIVNEEFGEIIQESEEETPGQTDNQDEENQHSSNDPTPNSSSNQTKNSTEPRITRDESENLADYLRIGMSIEEARNAFQKEIELAELRQKIRDSKREENRGAISSSSRTRIGPTTNTRGRGRGGLTFN